MAVNKNFVVKNGLEVGQSLILANASTNKVGIGTSIPIHTLHVFGGIGVTNFQATGISTFNSDVRVGGGISAVGVITGSSYYVGPVQVISNARQLQNILTLDATTTSTISAAIAAGPILTSSFSSIIVSGVSTFSDGPVIVGSATSTGTAAQRLQVTGGGYFSANVGIGSTRPTSRLYVIGDGYVTGVVTATSFKGSAQIGVQTESATTKTYIGLTSTISFVGSGITISHITGPSGITTITFAGGAGGGGGGVTQLIAGNNVTLNPSSGLGAVTISAGGSLGVYDGATYIGIATAIDFGSNLTVTPLSVGIVTVNASGTGGGGSGASITIGVRVGTAVTFAIVGAAFTVNQRVGFATVDVTT